MKANTIIQRFEQHFPQWMAEPDDPNGLHIGTLDKDVRNILISLDLRPDVVQEAIDKQVDLIIVKHPPIFQPVKRLIDTDPQTKMYHDLFKHDIAVYAAHTNMDIAPDGLNDWLMMKLGIEQSEYLSRIHHLPYEQLTVICHQPKFIEWLDEQQMMYTYQYHQLIVRVAPAQKAEVETQLKLLLPQAVPFWTTMTNCFEDYGIGRVGNLSTPMSLESFTQLVKRQFDVDHVRLITKTLDHQIKRVAICSGSGQKFYTDALAKGADVYITGDVYYHVGHDMQESGMPVIDAGHYIEHLCKEGVYQLCKQWKEENHWDDVMFMKSEVNTNPFRVY